MFAVWWEDGREKKAYIVSESEEVPEEKDMWIVVLW